MTAISFEIMPCTKEAAQLVMEWRNDEETRRNSFNQGKKIWPEFWNEFKNGYFKETQLPNYFIIVDGQRAGVMNVQRVAAVDGRQTATVSINIAPDRRGQGLGSLAYGAIKSVARNNGIQVLIAEVLTTNIASRKACEKAGYKIVDTITKKTPTGAEVEVNKLQARLTESFLLPNSTRAIGEGEPCFIVAEAGSNWKIGEAAENNKMARQLIDVAKEAGADAVKFQTFKAKTTYVSNAGDSEYLKESGEVRNVFDLLKDLEMPYEMVLELAEYAKQVDITFLTTAFSVDDLNAIDKCVPIHKIASYENSHLRLLEAAAATGKPTMMSTGASPVEEIDWSVGHFREMSKAPLILMQCTAAYPAPRQAMNLRTIPTLRSRYNCMVGLSDHSKDPTAAPLMAIALGASAIEKHFTMDNNLPGPDHQYAIEPAGLRAMVKAIREGEEMLGDGFKHVAPEEQELYLFAKRSLQALVDLKPGDVITEDLNIGILRPGSMSKGIHPRHLAQVAGRPVKKPVAQGAGLTFDHLQ